MITQHYITKVGSKIVLSIAFESAVLDIVSSEAEIQACLQLLDEQHGSSVREKLGSFGIYAIAMNLGRDDSASIFIDGPLYDDACNQSAGFIVDQTQLKRILALTLLNPSE